VEEYARSTNESLTEVRRRVEIAKLMVEFLEFINAPGQFHIARDLQVFFPLEELLKIIRKCREDEAEDIKIVVFNNILMQTSNDMTRFIRSMKSIVGSEYQDEFIDEQRELAAQVLEGLPAPGEVDTAFIREEVRTNEEVTQALERSMDKALTRARRNETRNRPVQLVEKANTLLEGIDQRILLKMSSAELRRLDAQISRLEGLIAGLRENM